MKRLVAASAALGLAACHLIAGIEPGEAECRVDGVKNGLESDVDCGGGCAKCADGKKCKAHEDCLDNACYMGTCLPPDCYDGRKNGTETDVDCGGDNNYCIRCEGGQACKQEYDCASSAMMPNGGACKNGVCVPTCCYDDCDGCVDLCANQCCHDPVDPQGACCKSSCGPNQLGSVCDPNMDDCYDPLVCDDDDMRCY